MILWDLEGMESEDLIWVILRCFRLIILGIQPIFTFRDRTYRTNHTFMSSELKFFLQNERIANLRRFLWNTKHISINPQSKHDPDPTALVTTQTYKKIKSRKFIWEYPENFYSCDFTKEIHKNVKICKQFCKLLFGKHQTAEKKRFFLLVWNVRLFIEKLCKFRTILLWFKKKTIFGLPIAVGKFKFFMVRPFAWEFPHL